MAWIRREDLEGLQAYTRSLGDDLKKRAAWAEWMLEHLWDRDWEAVRDEFDAAWRVRHSLEHAGNQSRVDYGATLQLPPLESEDATRRRLRSILRRK
jgi:hypothetical protein